jgi:hypothetical protein
MDPESRPTVSVEKLIALKRYEQPPPGYFDLLPGRILRRIERGEGQTRIWPAWWPVFNTRPVLAFALGLTVCGVLSVAILSSPKVDPAQAAGEMPSGEQWAAASFGSLSSGETASGVTGWLGSTNPVTAPQTGDSLFETPGARAMPVSLFRED